MLSWFKTLRLIIRNYRAVVRLQDRFPDLYIELPARFACDDDQAVEIGRGVSIGCYSEIVVLHAAKESRVPGQLIIGERAVIGSFSNIRACGGQIQIGNHVLIAQQVSLIASNHQLAPHAIYRDLPWDEKRTGISIGQNVWIGAGGVVLPGVEIGENSVVAAGAVVTQSIPPNEIWAGIPARKLRNI
jgi:acetyltransferase-like isoleucine patch superfamily enzyme